MRRLFFPIKKDSTAPNTGNKGTSIDADTSIIQDEVIVIRPNKISLKETNKPLIPKLTTIEINSGTKLLQKREMYGITYKCCFLKK
jgi:hypothetical protein